MDLMDMQVKKNKVQTSPWKAVVGYSMMTVQMAIQCQVNRALCNVVQLKMPLPIAGQLDQMTCKGSFQSKILFGSMKPADKYILQTLPGIAEISFLMMP